jgi:hypothetical protein
MFWPGVDGGGAAFHHGPPAATSSASRSAFPPLNTRVGGHGRYFANFARQLGPAHCLGLTPWASSGGLAVLFRRLVHPLYSGNRVIPR